MLGVRGKGGCTRGRLLVPRPYWAPLTLFDDTRDGMNGMYACRYRYRALSAMMRELLIFLERLSYSR